MLGRVQDVVDDLPHVGSCRGAVPASHELTIEQGASFGVFVVPKALGGGSPSCVGCSLPTVVTVCAIAGCRDTAYAVDVETRPPGQRFYALLSAYGFDMSTRYRGTGT